MMDLGRGGVGSDVGVGGTGVPFRGLGVWMRE